METKHTPTTMETKHTPGPWKVTPTAHGSYNVTHKRKFINDRQDIHVRDERNAYRLRDALNTLHEIGELSEQLGTCAPVNKGTLKEEERMDKALIRAQAFAKQ